MPYQWTETASARILILWPHQSLTATGFVWFIGTTAALLAVPLIAVLGSPTFWMLLVFFLAALGGVWRAIMVNHDHRRMHEKLTLSAENAHLEHVPHRGETLHWEANPYWVSVQIHQDGPIENYLTLKGGVREVEIGAFLTPEERSALWDELQQAFARLHH